MPTPAIITRDRDGLSAEFIRLRGQPQGSRVVLEPYVRPGQDGVGFIRLGKQGRPFTLIAFRDFADMPTAGEAVKALAENLQGETCTITDSCGVDWPGMVCLEVRVREPQPSLLSVGGLVEGSLAVCEIEMDFIAAG